MSETAEYEIQVRRSLKAAELIVKLQDKELDKIRQAIEDGNPVRFNIWSNKESTPFLFEVERFSIDENHDTWVHGFNLTTNAEESQILREITNISVEKALPNRHVSKQATSIIPPREDRLNFFSNSFLQAWSERKK